MTTSVIEVEELRKTYGATVAVDDISLRVSDGEIFCLVGPNGAGKTTTVECIEGLTIPDSGRVRVFGLDPVRERRALYARTGVLLQESTLHRRQRVREALEVFASFYPDPWPIADLLERCGLEGRERSFYGELSGGQKRRLLLALALIGRPRLLILDEPTASMDPQARYNIWQLLHERRATGTTILLTTHLLEEAQEQCDTICMVDHGRVIAMGSPRQLLAERRIETLIKVPVSNGFDPRRLEALPEATQVEALDSYVLIYGAGDDLYTRLTPALMAQGVAPRQIETRPARLEDLYLLMTGRAYRKE
ncbi:MAG: ABC transporter ATP-binding protein [Oscillochloridaceae bacterium]|nr:ABC transporter ATP-binding protein [Chloroflexaceae bacterium]MDW8390348.1 ABC transporter ATP-binding protein [Oscillochloridaceae bacterium]